MESIIYQHERVVIRAIHTTLYVEWLNTINTEDYKAALRFLLHYLKNADAKEPCQIIINQQLLRTFPDADVYFGEVWLPDLLALGRQLYLAFVSPTNFYGEFGLKNNLKKNFPEGNFTIAVCKDILTAERWIKDQIAPIALDIENI